MALLRKPFEESLIPLSLTLEFDRNCEQKNITADKPNKAKQKRTHTHKYLLQRRQSGIGGHGDAQCRHVTDEVAGETKKHSG